MKYAKKAKLEKNNLDVLINTLQLFIKIQRKANICDYNLKYSDLRNQ